MKNKKYYLALSLMLSVILLLNVTIYAADNNATNTEFRIKPLLEQLAEMDDATIDTYVNKFNDMGEHWSRRAVGKLTGLGIINGMTNDKFMPNAPVQADQFIKMCILAMGYKVEPGTDCWAQPYIEAALDEAIVEKGEFSDYNRPLSREEMARIIVRTTLKIDAAPDAKYDQYLKGKIIDYPEISDSLKQYVLDAYKLGLLMGMGNGRFSPKSPMTRAEASTVIIRILDRTERKPVKPGEDETIKLIDNLSNPMEIYPGVIREYFEIEKAMEKALPMAKGYAVLFYSPETGAVCVGMYSSYEAWNEDCITNIVASFQSNNTYKDPYNPYAYNLSVWQTEVYKELFAGYVQEILKALYEMEAQTAIALHDKYMNLKTYKSDGSNYYETTRLNDRYTELIGNPSGFSLYIKLKGE